MSSINTQEISKFQKDSAHWWDEKGPFKPLHKMNPTRLRFIRDNILNHYKQKTDDLKAYQDLTFLDIGCGGGLLCEPFARLGGKVTGVDADEQAINVAKAHAKQGSLHITYKCTTAEDLASTKQQFDIVTALEIIEHVDNPQDFLKNCLKLVKPGGLLFVSTLNRTPKSLLLGKIAAEYILRLVPQDTHEWKKFVKPSEISNILSTERFVIKDIKGINYSILKDKFKLETKDISVNYILCAQKESA